ncbi:MAG: hypothetical protein M0R03_21695 [Novosphingobium sp.]|nr:hypothetical protein [Novosphingobium sp.]
MSVKADEARKSGVVHFTIGEDMGIRLMEIAQEHLTHENNPEKALKAITDSLIGCPTDYALKILKGDIVLFVDVENQNIMPTERIPEIHDRIFPKIDVLQFMERNELQIEKHRMNLVAGWRTLENQIRENKNTLWVGFDYEDIFKFISGNNESVLETLRDLEEVDQIETLIAVTKKFIEHTMKIQSTMEWMSKTWSDFETVSGEDKKNPWVEYIAIKDNISECLTDVMQEMQNVLNLNFNLTLVENNVQNYLDSMKEIDTVLSEGIKPVDIFDNYSAGWLSPEGEYYALNGEIANMLHNQIADSLQEIGIIPKDTNNPDSWLEQNGWVKIHTDNINFAGCLNNESLSGKPNVNMTNVQVEMIKNYINRCHNGIMRLGWKMEKVSASRFEMTAMNNMSMLNKNYFKF